jgi:hypothetical protein
VHGGATRTTEAANARRTLEADVRRLLPPRENWPKVESSLDELYDLAAEARAFREALAERVAQLGDAGTRDQFGRETVRAVIQVYVQAIEQSAKIATSIARLGIDERRLALSAQHDQLMKLALLHALAALGVPMTDSRLDVVMPQAVQRARLELVGGQ